MAGVGSQLQYCCYRSSPRSLPVSHGRYSYRLLTLPSSSRLRHVSSVRASGSRRDRDPAGENKDVLNAFFLGKAVAESVTERVGTIVGELLSDIGRWQSEQQKQIRDFQEEVQERAQKAKLKAAQEAKNTSTTITYDGSGQRAASSSLLSPTEQNSLEDRTDP